MTDMRRSHGRPGKVSDTTGPSQRDTEGTEGTEGTERQGVDQVEGKLVAVDGNLGLNLPSFSTRFHLNMEASGLDG